MSELKFYRRFTNLDQAYILIELLNENEITCELRKIQPNIGTSIVGGAYDDVYEIHILTSDFQKANRLLETNIESATENIQNDNKELSNEPADYSETPSSSTKKRKVKNANLGESIFISIVIIAAVIYIIYSQIESHNYKEFIKEDYELTIGGVESVDRWGDPANSYMVYYYYIDDIKYTREVMNSRLGKLAYHYDKCKDKKYWVAYSTRDPSMSLINIYHEIQNQENPIPLPNLDWYK
ncbi:putative signal transducing protein [Fulvivirga lutea]|uniref:DUF2007 domain-containing protein n=1 Tax=Fulvivirga lutea TaxID=2810512 RepID=A0A974WFT0_9BACT|nr:hypothetical protein [Fulvivirga lutea]QSE97215.1 hypothetical protein JR347_16735 [Fulvivirga lutea]